MMSTPMSEGRRADAARRRQKIIKAISDASRDGTELSVSAVARRAGVDRSTIYRHRDLLEQIHLAQAAGPSMPGGGAAAVSRESLRADLAAAQDRNARLHARNRQLEARLSALLGEQAWRESGLGAPDDIESLKSAVTALQQQAAEQQRILGEREQELTAARAANRSLMAQLNTVAR